MEYSGSTPAREQTLDEWDAGSLHAKGEYTKFRSAFILGPRGSGKTALVSSWLRELRKRAASRGGYHAIFVYSANPHTLRGYAPLIGEMLVVDQDGRPLNLIDWEQAGTQHIERVLAEQDTRAQAGRKKLRILMVLDDCVGRSTRAGDSSLIVETLATQGRHSGVAFWLVSQTLSSSFTPTTRRNIDLWMLFGTRSGTERALVVEDVIEGAIDEESVGVLATPGSGTVPTTRRKLASLLYSEASRDYGMLVVDHRHHKTEARETLFTYRLAADDVRRYERLTSDRGTS